MVLFLFPGQLVGTSCSPRPPGCYQSHFESSWLAPVTFLDHLVAGLILRTTCWHQSHSKTTWFEMISFPDPLQYSTYNNLTESLGMRLTSTGTIIYSNNITLSHMDNVPHSSSVAMPPQLSYSSTWRRMRGGTQGQQRTCHSSQVERTVLI